MNYPETILRDLRRREGLKVDDTSRDEVYNTWPKDVVLDEVLRFHGLLGYGNFIINLVESIYNVDLNSGKTEPQRGDQSNDTK